MMGRVTGYLPIIRGSYNTNQYGLAEMRGLLCSLDYLVISCLREKTPYTTSMTKRRFHLRDQESQQVLL